MKVILLEELRGKGGEGDVVEVARGFANNYLLPKGIAVKATDGNLKQLEQRRHNIAKREETRINSATTRKGQIEALKLVIPTRVGDEGQLFGSITAQMIADAIMEQGNVEVDRRRVEIRVPIKTAGDHEVEVSLYRDIKATVKLSVVDENAVEEDAAQADADDLGADAESADPADAVAEAVAPEADAAGEAVEDAVEETGAVE